jgi:hypothetical protein
MRRLPHPRSCFFEQPVLQHLLGQGLLEIAPLAAQVLTSPEEAWRAVSPASRLLPAYRNSFDQL